MLIESIKQVVAVCVVLILSACASMAPIGDQTVLISDEIVQQKLNERLSAPIVLLNIFNLQLSSTKVTFDEAANRMRVSLDSDLTSSLFKDHFTGNAMISGMVDYDVQRQVVLLKEPEVAELAFDELNSKQADLFSAFAKAIGNEVLHGLVLYRFDESDPSLNGKKLKPKALQITSEGLRLKLESE